MALAGHLWAKVMVCVLALAVVLEPCADTCFSSLENVARLQRISPISPSSLHHLGAGPHNADGLFSFPRRARQNPQVVNARGGICVGHLISSVIELITANPRSLPPSSAFHHLTGIVLPKGLEFIMSAGRLKQVTRNAACLDVFVKFAAGLSDCDGMRRLQ